MSFLIRMHFIDKTYSYQSSRFLWSVCVLGTPASPEKTAESIEMLFRGGGNSCRPKKPNIDGVQIGATRRIGLNDPCAAAMRPYVKLL